jgi:hypothetical protein
MNRKATRAFCPVALDHKHTFQALPTLHSGQPALLLRCAACESLLVSFGGLERSHFVPCRQ